MSSIMRARNELTGRSEVSEVIGALSRAEGCWTFDARDRMPRQSRATAHHLGENAPTATRTPSRERVRSSTQSGHPPQSARSQGVPHSHDLRDGLAGAQSSRWSNARWSPFYNTQSRLGGRERHIVGHYRLGEALEGERANLFGCDASP